MLDSSVASVSTAITGRLHSIFVIGVALSSEYKNLDELTKMMLLKLKDIHQQIQVEGEKWFETRSDICTDFSKLFYILVDGLTPFLTNVEAVHDSSEELLKMIKKVDAYTTNLEKRVHEMF